MPLWKPSERANDSAEAVYCEVDADRVVPSKHSFFSERARRSRSRFCVVLHDNALFSGDIQKIKRHAGNNGKKDSGF